jgi:hypothetical protein
MRQSMTAVFIAAVFAAGASAQSYPEKQQPDKKATEANAQKVTIAGCVREGDTPNTFYLANVDPNALAAHHGSGTTGTSGMPPAPVGSAPTAPNTTTVRLISAGDIDLKAHVGHKIEVSGTIVRSAGEPATPSTGAAGTSGTATTDTTSRDRASEKDKDKLKTLDHAHKVNVRSVKMISEKCSM